MRKMLFPIIAALMLTTTSYTSAHSWYPYECCSDNDCERVKVNTVKEKDGGFEVIVYPGQHKMSKDWAEPMVYHVPYKDARASEDQNYHVCLSPTKVLLCLFVPIGGV